MLENSLSLRIRNFFRQESIAIEALSALSEECARAVELILSSDAPLIVSGIGKSGHIAAKTASTLTSLGKPSIFIHAAEASHGDLGLVQKGSIIIIMSHSGQTAELTDLIHYAKIHGNPIIAITGNKESFLSQSAQLRLIYDAPNEADLAGVAPTISTALSLGLGDAIAVGLAQSLTTTIEDFRRYHPGGNLGDQLLEAQDIMRPLNALHPINLEADTHELLMAMTEDRLGLGILVEGDKVYGVITDGDLRRNLENIREISPKSIASTDPIRVQKTQKAFELRQIMREKSVSQVLVYDEENFIGVVHILMLTGGV